MSSAAGCRRFSLAEIQSATKNFDDKLIIGRGGFGTVYKGHISSEKNGYDEQGEFREVFKRYYICEDDRNREDESRNRFRGEISSSKDGHVVAVKRLDSMSNQGEDEFQAEIKMISMIRNYHLVSLFGYCHENKEMILVYKYMTNGTLYHHLHKANKPLSWLTRLKIAIGAARGLDYLHNWCGPQHGVIHRDVKSSNILLDENWAAMISDFGLSKIGPTNQLKTYVDTGVKGTFGYLDPEYFYTGKITRKTDVYAFGVVLFELLSGRLPVDDRNGEDQCSLVRWAQRCVEEGKIDQLVDSNIKGTISPKCLKQFVQIANRCVQSVLNERPTMTEVVTSLLALLEQPEQSKYFSVLSGINDILGKMHKYFASNSVIDRHEDGIKKFTYKELKLATRDFQDTICLYVESGKMVYKGWVDKTTYSPSQEDNRLPIAVIKLNTKLPGLKMLKEFRHPNIVQLIGFSSEGGRDYLVYEFTSKVNFRDLLHSGAIARLPLVTKVKMLVGIARGIVFLQKPELNTTYPKVSESVLQRRKILLDEDFTAKLSDYDSGHYNKAYPDIDGIDLVLKCDQSGFKVIFLEVLTGKRIDSSNRAKYLDRHFSDGGKQPVDSISKLCFEMCNDVDAESIMLKMLKERKKLIDTEISLCKYYI